MAKHASLIMGQMTGKLGDAVFSVHKGVQQVRKYSYTNSSNGNGASLPQRLVRLRLASLAGMYDVLKPFMQYAFQSKNNLISDYNAFVKANAKNNQIIFSKSEVANGSRCVGPVIIANGTLPELLCTLGDDFNYRIGLKASISEGMTLGQFAREVVGKNAGWAYGDKLTIVLIKNGLRTGFTEDVFTSDASYYSITLDVADSKSLASVAPALKSDAQGLLYIDDVNSAIATSIAACHSRKNGTQLFVSPTFVCCEKDDAVALLKMDSHVDAAAVSYGYKDVALLEPDYNGTTPSNPTQNARIQKILVGGVEIAAGSPISITEPTTFEVRGVNLLGSLIVSMDGNVWNPESIENGIAEFTISQSGSLRVVCGSQNFVFEVTYTGETAREISTVTVNEDSIAQGASTIVNFSPCAIKVTGTGFTGLTSADVTTSAGSVYDVQVTGDTQITFKLSTNEGQTANVKVDGIVVAVVKHQEPELPDAE